VELFNAGLSSINLEGFRISDDQQPGTGFTFPAYTLLPNSRVLIFASGSSAEAPVHHYEMPVDGIGQWKYAIGSDLVESNWRDLGYDDSQWETGSGGIGFGDGDDGTVIPMSQAVFMRKTFTIQDSTKIVEAILIMDFDDGFTAYLNGVEIASMNMWPGKVPWTVFATLAHEAQMYQGLEPDSFYIDYSLLKSILRSGENVLAVQTHNVEPNSSDLSSIPFLIFGVTDSIVSFPPPPIWFNQPLTETFQADFKLSRDGETVYLFNSSDDIIDEKTYQTLQSDHCYARTYDGSADWCLTDSPSPLAANDPGRCFIDYTSKPVFTLNSGFYSSPQSLNILSSHPGSEIRFSTNGDDPGQFDQLYSSSIAIDSSSVIRARIYAPGYLPGQTITHTYLINEVSRLPVFSIVTDSLNLWDYNSGIYVEGPNADTITPFFGANFWQDWHKPAAIEYFDKSKQSVFHFNADIEIYGNYSRAKPQKSFEIYLSDRNGIGSISYPLIPDKSFIREYENIILRNSGTDNNYVHFRDALMERIMKNTHSGYVAAQPVRMFLNGADWGVYTVHEKHNHKWIESNYELDKGEYDYLSEEGIYINLEKGSDVDFFKLYEFATEQSPSDSGFYEQVNSMLDLKNFADYFIAETYYNNGDWIGEWTNNIKMWKPKAPGSKWKYILHDLDFGLGLKGNVTDNRLAMAIDPIAFSHTSEIFDAMLRNDRFKKYFINRYADLINTIYLPGEIDKIMHQFKDSMATDMFYHFQKWGNDTNYWNGRINIMMSFANQRPAIMRNMIKDQFGLTSQVNLSLNTSPPGSGRIEINTITPLSYPWTGVYYNGNPVSITAIPNPGYTFDHWTATEITTNNQDQKVELNFTNDDQITAHFTGSAQDAQINISEFNYHSIQSYDAEDWIELHNYGTKAVDISHWKLKDEADNHIFNFPTGTVLPANSYLVITEDTCAFDQFYPHVNNRIGQLGFTLKNSGELIRLFNHLDVLYISFSYQTTNPWPVEADGQGYTCELKNNSTDLNDGNNWSAGCFGGSPGAASSTSLNVNIPLTSVYKFCQGSNDTLSIAEIQNSTYKWLFNNTAISGADESFITVNEEGVYQLEIEIGGCRGATDPVFVNMIDLAKEPEITSGSRCGQGQVILFANSNDPVNWYDSKTSEPVSTGNTFLTPFLSESKTYYVKAGYDCPSNFAEVKAKIRTECESNISVYPNPSTLGTSLLLHYDNLKSEPALLRVTDLFGNVIQSLSMQLSEYSSTYELPLAEVSQGIYLISLHQGDDVYIAKFVRN
jgi:hypothetical protein